ncbi:MAG: metallophosphoesterase [Synergistaceae bacterium]
MVRKNAWTVKQMLELYEYKFKQKLSNKKIALKLGKSGGSIGQKLVRTDWDEFIKDPNGYMDGNEANGRKWTQGEMGLLYAYLGEGKSNAFIAERIGRGIISVERKAQTTDWKAWLASVGDPENPNEGGIDNEELVEKLVDALVVLSRQQIDRLDVISEAEFRRKVNYENKLPIPFSKIKIQADNVLESLGVKNPEELQMGEGTYIVVSDSHGKFTKNSMFKLLHHIDKVFNPKKIIHLGHLLDDDNDISCNWGKFNNLIVVSKVEELSMVQKQRHKLNFSYDIVRGCVTLGEDLVVMNQDLINDYVKTPLSSLDSEIFDQKVIVNCHRQEFFPKCSEQNEVSYIASPGALCERHIVRTIKQIDFEDGKHVKQANWTGFSKYRRMKHMYKYWKQGVLIVHVDSRGKHTIVPCLIQRVKKNGFATSYFDKIISNTGVHKPVQKIFITADSHSPRHRKEVLDVQEQIAKAYEPDIYVNLGDAADYRTLNHHILDRGGVIIGDIIEDAASVNQVMKRQKKWAKKCYVQKGNHERFANDFIEKFPQLKNLLNFDFLCSVSDLGYQVTELKTPLKIGKTTFVHGDMRLWGQSGSKVEKFSKTFGDIVFMGDSHYPAIRYGTYVVGLSGELDQSYNEASASSWIHGFGMCNHYAGKSWPTTIAIVDDECRINNSIYCPKHPENWELKKYHARIAYD